MAINGKLWETTHEGKMQGFKSISTSSNTNKYCKMRREIKGTVCCHCYAKKYTLCRSTLEKRIAQNTSVLSRQLLSEIETPLINDCFYRFESFGDLRNTMHLHNFVLIAERNPNTQFALWTKNLPFIRKLFIHKGIAKPDNLNILYSSIRLNEQAHVPQDVRPYIDHVFTVYDKVWICDHPETEINCKKGNQCIRCLKCYVKGGAYYINEALK